MRSRADRAVHFHSDQDRTRGQDKGPRLPSMAPRAAGAQEPGAHVGLSAENVMDDAGLQSGGAAVRIVEAEFRRGPEVATAATQIGSQRFLTVGHTVQRAELSEELRRRRGRERGKTE